MPHKDNSLQDHALIPMPDFEMAVKKVVNVPKQDVGTKFANFKASNKARRQSRKSKPA